MAGLGVVGTLYHKWRIGSLSARLENKTAIEELQRIQEIARNWRSMEIVSESGELFPDPNNFPTQTQTLERNYLLQKYELSFWLPPHELTKGIERFIFLIRQYGYRKAKKMMLKPSYEEE